VGRMSQIIHHNVAVFSHHCSLTILRVPSLQSERQFSNPLPAFYRADNLQRHLTDSFSSLFSRRSVFDVSILRRDSSARMISTLRKEGGKIVDKKKSVLNYHEEGSVTKMWAKKIVRVHESKRE